MWVLLHPVFIPGNLCSGHSALALQLPSLRLCRGRQRRPGLQSEPTSRGKIIKAGYKPCMPPVSKGQVLRGSCCHLVLQAAWTATHSAMPLASDPVYNVKWEAFTVIGGPDDIVKHLSHFVPHVLAQISQIPRQLGAHDQYVMSVMWSIYHKTRNMREGSVERRIPCTSSVASSGASHSSSTNGCPLRITNQPLM
jgi:hypothetical protein